MTRRLTAFLLRECWFCDSPTASFSHRARVSRIGTTLHNPARIAILYCACKPNPEPQDRAMPSKQDIEASQTLLGPTARRWRPS